MHPHCIFAAIAAAAADVSASCKEMASMANRNTDFERCDDRPMQDGGADSDDEFLDDPLAVASQHRPSMPQVDKPAHVSQETHDLVRATMAGGEAYRATREAEVEALRARRLAELKGAAPLVTTVVDPAKMLDAIRRADAATPVVIHVSSSAVPACAKVDRALGLLAARQAAHPSDCRFVGAAAPVLLRLDAEATCLAHEAFGMEINEAELPALLVYRDRELVHHALAVRFDDADDVEDFIEAGLS